MVGYIDFKMDNGLLSNFIQGKEFILCVIY